MKIYIKRELVASKENLAKFGKNKKNENFRRREFVFTARVCFAPRESGKKENLGGKERGDHGIEWKFY